MINFKKRKFYWTFVIINEKVDKILLQKKSRRMSL